MLRWPAHCGHASLCVHVCVCVQGGGCLPHGFGCEGLGSVRPDPFPSCPHVAQVLAIFAKSKVQWPPGIKNLFRYLSFFNLNIDITAPECLAPNLNFGFKWFAMQGMPVAALSLFVVLFVLRILYARIVKGQRKGLTDSYPALVSTVITMIYFLCVGCGL